MDSDAAPAPNRIPLYRALAMAEARYGYSPGPLPAPVARRILDLLDRGRTPAEIREEVGVGDAAIKKALVDRRRGGAR